MQHRDSNWLRQKYQQEKFNAREIAKIAGVSKGTIMYWMKKYGIPRRRKGQRNLRIWSSVHGLDACRDCGSSGQPHHSLGLCQTCYHRQWRYKDPERITQKARRYRDKLRYEVLSAYGGAPPRCACCGEEYIEFLQIDHINGDGKKHRKGLDGSDFYVGLRKRGFPKGLGLRVLCSNCNFARGHYGYCPHSP